MTVTLALDGGPSVAFDLRTDLPEPEPSRDAVGLVLARADGLPDDERARLDDWAILSLLAALGAPLGVLVAPGLDASDADVQVRLRDWRGQVDVENVAGMLANRAQRSSRPPAARVADATAALELLGATGTDARTRTFALDARACARRAARDPGGALADFDAALAADPAYAAARNNRAMLHLAEGRAEAAVEDARAAFDLDRSALHRLSVAEALAARNAPGDRDEAVSLVLLALDRDPSLARHLAGAAYDPLRAHPRFPTVR